MCNAALHCSVHHGLHVLILAAWVLRDAMYASLLCSDVLSDGCCLMVATLQAAASSSSTYTVGLNVTYIGSPYGRNMLALAVNSQPLGICDVCGFCDGVATAAATRNDKVAGAAARTHYSVVQPADYSAGEFWFADMPCA